jgi:very-short-patch-repair endonuclease
MDINVDLRDGRGRFLARPDIRFPEYRVVVEYEGDGHRTDRAQWNRDLIRTAALFEAGEHVIRIGAAQLHRPAVFLKQLRAALVARGWSPSP